MKRLLPVALSAVALVSVFVLMLRPVPQTMRERPAPTSTSTTTTTLVTNVKQPWGSVSAAGLALSKVDVCNNAMVTVDVTDPAALGRPERWVQLKGSSGNLYAVTPAVLKPGPNAVILTLCARQETEWRPMVKAPWGEQAFTVKSFPRCVHEVTEVALGDDTLVLTSFCPEPKS